jgi:hypothetical protein
VVTRHPKPPDDADLIEVEDADGNITILATWTDEDGVSHTQRQDDQ